MKETVAQTLFVCVSHITASIITVVVKTSKDEPYGCSHFGAVFRETRHERPLTSLERQLFRSSLNLCVREIVLRVFYLDGAIAIDRNWAERVFERGYTKLIERD